MSILPIHRRQLFSLATLGLLSSFALLGCKGTGAGGGLQTEPEISGSFKNCFSDSVRVYEIVGNQLKQIASAALEKADGERTFSLKSKLPGAGVYQIGIDPKNSTPIILGYDAKVEVTADCANLAASLTTDSETNNSYKSFMQRNIAYQQKIQSLSQNYQMTMMANPAEAERIRQQVDAEAKGHEVWLDSLRPTKDVIGTLAGIYYFPTFKPGGPHATEGEHFMHEFFAGVNWADPNLPQTPHLMEKTQVYAANLFNRGLPEDSAVAALNRLLAKAPKGNVARMVHWGIASGLEQIRNDNFADFALSYATNYPEDPNAASMRAAAEQMGRLRKGVEAPTFSLATADGSRNLGPADFKGKYLLLDFWASWCKPCRMENPNVVKVYGKYKGADFDILSVSLDQDKQKWLQAIQQDGLTWSHVSDLRGFQCQAAQLYGVNAIPSTFLLDREGKILAKNLRGPQLEAKMVELLGAR
jgi:peroxiredoxin